MTCLFSQRKEIKVPRLIIAALSLFLFTSAQAASPPEKSNTYEVEVLVFRNLMPSLTGNELWNQDTVRTSIPGLDKAITPVAAPPADPILSDAARKLSHNPHYRVLAHYSWIQTADIRSASTPVRITASEPGNPQALDGTILFYMSRYLHVELNLVLRDPPTASAASNTNMTTGSTQVSAQPAPVSTVYVMKQHRRIRSDVTEYFDHPMFGVLLRVTEIKTDPSQPAAKTPLN